MAVKLNGLTAKTKPSSGRYSSRFHTPGEEIGCSSYIRIMNSTLKRQKSISSQAASISAWCTVFDWFSIVAATIVERQGPASSSAARRKTAARSAQGRVDQSACAPRAAAIAWSTCSAPPFATSASTCSLRCGITASKVAAGLDVGAADDQRDLETLELHLADPGLELGALGRARCVRPDRLVRRRRRPEDAGGGHATDCRVVAMRVTRHAYAVEGWGVGELWEADGRVVVAHDAPTERRNGPRGRTGRPY